MSCCKSCWSLLQTVEAISGDVHLLSLGIVPGVRLESFLVSSNFFFSRHTLEYVLKPVKTCTAQKIWHFFASSHSVSYNAIDCGLSSPTTNLYQASAIYQILNTRHSESGEVCPIHSFSTLGQLDIIWHSKSPSLRYVHPIFGLIYPVKQGKLHHCFLLPLSSDESLE